MFLFLLFINFDHAYIRYLRDTPVLFPFTKALDKFIFKEKAKE